MSSHRKDDDYWANLLQATKERLEEEEHEREEQQQQPGLEELFTNAPSTPTPQLHENDVVDSINPNVIHHLHPALGEGDKHPVKKHPKRVQIARRDSSSGIRTPERVDSKSDLSAITSKIAARLQTPPSTRRRMADQTRTIMELENENDSDSDSDEDEDEEEEDETDYQPVPPFQLQILAPTPIEPTFVGDIKQIHPIEAQEKIEIQEKTPLLPTTMHIEDGASKRTWAASLPVWIVLLCVCVSESSRGMVVPSLWPYLQSMGGSTSELGYLVGIYSAGRLAGSLGLGWWFNKRGAKEALIISLAIAVAGNFLYSLASLFNSFVVLLLSRLITGFGTGLLSVGRAFVAEVTTTKERTKYISYVSAVQFIGFAITPGLGAALGLLPAFYIGEWKLSELNTPGLLLSVLTFIVLLLAVFLFPSQSVLEKEKEKVVTAQRMLDSKVHKEELPSNVILTGVILFIVLNAVVRGIIALIETVATPVFLDAWDDFRTEPIDPVTDTSWMLLGLGCIGLVVILATPYLTRFLKEPYLLAFSFLVMGFGAVLLIDYSKTQEGLSLAQFLFGAALIWSIGSPISQTIIIATFSKLLGTKPQGTMMGWISAAGSVGRIVLPLLSSVLGTRVSLIVSAVLALLCTTTPVFFLKFRDASHRRSYYRDPYGAPSIIV